MRDLTSFPGWPVFLLTFFYLPWSYANYVTAWWTIVQTVFIKLIYSCLLQIILFHNDTFLSGWQIQYQATSLGTEHTIKASLILNTPIILGITGT
jgi:hypothetical protein